MLRSLLHDTPLNPLSRGDFYFVTLQRENRTFTILFNTISSLILSELFLKQIAQFYALFLRLS